MAIYSRLKKIVKKINETYVGRLLLLVPLIFYFQSKQIKFKLSNLFYSYFYYYSGRLCRNNDLTIGIKKLGEKKIQFPHPIGIVIGKYVKIGSDCIIYQNVTIGAKSQKDAIQKKYPTLGHNVIIGANTVILGDVNIGNNVVIGASVFVNKDIPDNTIVYGSQTRVKTYKEEW